MLTKPSSTTTCGLCAVYRPYIKDQGTRVATVMPGEHPTWNYAYARNYLDPWPACASLIAYCASLWASCSLGHSTWHVHLTRSSYSCWKTCHLLAYRWPLWSNYSFYHPFGFSSQICPHSFAWALRLRRLLSHLAFAGRPALPNHASALLLFVVRERQQIDTPRQSSVYI